MRVQLVGGKLCVLENLVEQAGANCLPGVDWDHRATAVGVNQEVVAAPATQHLEAGAT